MLSSSRLWLALALPALLALGACEQGQPPRQPGPLEGSALTGAFSLIDTTGQPVSSADFAGRWQMVYFGYAYCPDVCPFDVQRMVRGHQLFSAEHPELADDVQPIFITVDPARDTPEVLAQFTASFGDNLIGLTGTSEAIEAAAAAFFVAYSKGEPGPGGGYLVDHSRAGYLLDRQGRPIALLPVESSPEAVAAELAKWVH